MVHTKTMGRKLKTKFRRFVILPIHSAIKLNTLTDSKIWKKELP